MIEEVLKYLKEHGVEIDEHMLKYIENGVDITEEDEYKHDFGIFPKNHNESWYFNFIDRKANVFFVTRLSMRMGEKNSRILSILVVDGKPNAYVNMLDLKEMPDNWEYDKKLHYYCIEPMKKWKVKFEDKKYKLDVTFEARFEAYNYLSNEDPLEGLKKFGVQLLEVAAQQHYEQGMKVKGTLVLKKLGETRNINCLGHRDHSWGTRDWINIDRWNWISAQFKDMTINIARIQVFDKIIQTGFVSTKGGNISIRNVDITTKTKEDGKTPVSSTFLLTDDNGKKIKVVSTTIKSLHLQVPTPGASGMTEVFEQIAIFNLDGNEGDGISEYMMSIRK